tara:strand:- start:474 stop:698 length:225 start_codon:yes stop_codon:yes gene_type:complete
LEASKIFLVLLYNTFYFNGDVMISWLNATLELCQDKLALTKAWLDTEMPVKNRVVVAVATVNAIVIIGLLMVAI